LKNKENGRINKKEVLLAQCLREDRKRQPMVLTMIEDETNSPDPTFFLEGHAQNN
jgi:hypothetical protein